MEYFQNTIIIAFCVVLGTILYSLRKFYHSPGKIVITDAHYAKKILSSSDIVSRARSNQHLHFAFGISNPFTNSNDSYHKSFRKIIADTINLNKEQWKRNKNIAIEAVDKYTKDGVVEIVPWIQQITLNVVLRGYLGMDMNVDEITNNAPDMINDLWINSKGINPVMAEQNENLTSILATKRMLKDLLCKASSTTRQKGQKEASRTSNVIQEISRIARTHFPSAFDHMCTNIPETKDLHNPSAEDLESPLNILIPAYETMWRVVLYAILEIKVRPLLRSNDVADFGNLDDAVKIFLENPSTLEKASPLWCIINETLRLYPPTRNIHRINDEKLRIIVEVEKIQRDPKYWGEDALFFKPERFLKETNLSNVAQYLPFSIGRLKCVAEKFAPALAAIIISVILNHVDDIVPNQKTREQLLQEGNLPFKNNRRAFDKLEFTITKRCNIRS